MVVNWRILAGAVLASAALSVQAGELGVLKPTGELRDAPRASVKAPVVTRLSDGPLFATLQAQAKTGTLARMLELDEMAAKLSGSSGAVTWLYVAPEDGGFARHGFWLREGEQLRWMDEPYLDLVTDEDSIADGSFEETFAHELGHVFLRRLLPRLPPGYARNAHHSHAITDQPTAFDEGLATAMQPYAKLISTNPAVKAQETGLSWKAFTPLWQSNIDRELRTVGVRGNWFVHRQVTPPGLGAPVERRDMSTLFDRARFKSAPQMLANEGAVASFLYRYLADGDSTERFNALFRALSEMNKENLQADSPLLPMLAQKMAEVDKDESKRFIEVLMQSSHGILASARFIRSAEALGQSGRFGNAKVFVPALKEARLELAQEIARVIDAPEQLAKAAGAQLWVMKGKLSADLNTAETEHFEALGFDRATSTRILVARDKDGLFAHLDDVIHRARLSPQAGRMLKAMSAAAYKAGPFKRD
jgi:hypothetical protein